MSLYVTLRPMLLTLALLISPIVLGAEFSLSQGDTDADSLQISGEIKRGDYARFQQFLTQPGNFWGLGNYVLLSSKGGDVDEALKFANLFETASIRVMVSDYCYSSCFIMYMAGVDRGLIGPGELGVHRMALSKSDRDIGRARSLISPKASSVRDYLAYLGTPSKILDKMNETPASGLYRMDTFSLKDAGLLAVMGYQPIFLDVVEQACGRNPDPYPGEFIRTRPRSDEVMNSIRIWAKCMRKVRLDNFSIFLRKEYKLLVSGKPSIAFPPNSVAEVERNVFH